MWTGFSAEALIKLVIYFDYRLRRRTITESAIRPTPMRTRRTGSVIPEKNPAKISMPLWKGPARAAALWLRLRASADHPAEPTEKSVKHVKIVTLHSWLSLVRLLVHLDRLLQTRVSSPIPRLLQHRFHGLAGNPHHLVVVQR